MIPDGWGQCAFIDRKTRQVLLTDNSQEQVGEKLYAGASFLLGLVSIGVKDCAFIPEQDMAVVLMGSGHLYFYDLRKGALAKTVNLSHLTQDEN
ncbi:MAG: hypothetical protein RMJ19_12250 [Gemmatales bacterium]|nr:hypothetical protein [Gemmatales bacterium]MDW8176437.1 hypothetical protein [Gemmatales bacterium]